MSVRIREAATGDGPSLRALLDAAMGPAESKLVEDLAATGVLLVMLVAIDEAAAGLVGTVAVSRLSVDAGRASVLAPLAVAESHRRRGIGSRLVTEALDRRRRSGDDAVLVLGDPAFYGRFGFSAAQARSFRTPWDGPHQQAIILRESGGDLGGLVRYPDTFGGLG